MRRRTSEGTAEFIKPDEERVSVELPPYGA
jgi:hypothetical protein